MNYGERLVGHVEIDVQQQTGETHITVHDAASGVIAAELRMDTRDFLQSIARFGSSRCHFWVNGSKCVGAVLETKSDLVPFDFTVHKHPKDTDPDGYRTPEVAKALKPFEVDGWQGDVRDMWNGHQRDWNCDRGETFQWVRFHRFVKDGVVVAAVED